MIIIALQNRRQDAFVSRCFLLIVGMVVVLSAVVIVETESVRFGQMVPAVLATFLGFAIRPFCLYVFILLAVRRFEKWEKLALIPLVVNVLLYATSFFLFSEPLSHLTFYYTVNPDGTLLFNRGSLNFFAHVLAAIYLLFLGYLSVRRLRGRHRADAISILICVAFTAGAVIIEMTGNAMGVLNLTIAIGGVFYYIFLLSEANRRDGLTHLFDRKTYYADIKRFDKAITGVIAIDMNGLKVLNDTQGHEGGDAALKTIGLCLEECCPHSMYIYRIGGDEFTILCHRGTLEEIALIGERIRAYVGEKGYSVSVGYAMRTPPSVSIDEAIAAADEAMYADKARYYQEHTELDRRRHVAE